jgi:hypothetical protein
MVPRRSQPIEPLPHGGFVPWPQTDAADLLSLELLECGPNETLQRLGIDRQLAVENPSRDRQCQLHRVRLGLLAQQQAQGSERLDVAGELLQHRRKLGPPRRLAFAIA